MTKQEMDLFLEGIGGLENGFFTDRPPIVDSNFFSIGEGWYPLIKRLIQDLIKLGWNRQICQVKEKFGGLRFYIQEGTDEVFERIRSAEEESLTICEVTGEPGTLRTDIGWYRTLSDVQYKTVKGVTRADD
jgi:hypothetical protein